MAKELPYFKFEPNQWEIGNIQILSREDKGLFVDLCSMYWSRLGDVPFKLAVQKLCGGNATAFNSLCDEKIIEVIEGNIFIKFLSEQLNEFEDLSKKNSKNAKERWEKHRKQKEKSDRNATASKSQCESDAIREEKIREKNNTSLDLKIDWEKLLNQFNKITGKNTKVINQQVKNKILARLKEGYSKQDLLNAIENCFNDPYHKETNHKHLTLEFISRTDKMEKYSTIKSL